MGYKIETKQTTNVESVLSTTEKCFAVSVIESQTFSAPLFLKISLRYILRLKINCYFSTNARSKM
jgi:hypothetical protein